MRVYKDKQYLVFDFEDGRTVKYDFAKKQAIGIKGKPVKDLCDQLRGFTTNQLLECCVDKNYANFLMFVRDMEEYPIYNIGTLLSKVPAYSRFEQLYSAGIGELIESRERRYFRYSIDEIPKSFIKLCKKYNLKISSLMVYSYKKNPDAYLIAFNSEYLSLTHQDIYKVWKEWTYLKISSQSSIVHSYFEGLVNNLGYNAKDLWLYLDRVKTFEAIEDMSYFIRELYDYASMMRRIGPKYDKYPHNFLTAHQIACRNYNRLKQKFSEELFQKRIDTQYECSFGDYVFIYPKSTREIKQEACIQNNCVASYIDRVIDGECHILFLRKRNVPDESLVTIEVRNNQIVQAKRKFNNPVTKEDQEAIDAFNKKFAGGKEKKS